MPLINKNVKKAKNKLRFLHENISPRFQMTSSINSRHKLSISWQVWEYADLMSERGEAQLFSAKNSVSIRLGLAVSTQLLELGARTNENKPKHSTQIRFLSFLKKMWGSLLRFVLCSLYCVQWSDHLDPVKICIAYDKRQTSDLLRRTHYTSVSHDALAAVGLPRVCIMFVWLNLHFV